MQEQNRAGNCVTSALPFDINQAVDVSVLDSMVHVDDAYLATTLHNRPAPLDPNVKWEPKQVKPYSEAKKIYIVDEFQAEGMTPERVIMIALLLDGPFDEPDDMIIFEANNANDDAAEAEILTQLINTIERLEPDFISFHAASFFTVPALVKRLNAVGVDHGFRVEEEPQPLASGTLFGTPVSYTPVHLTLAGKPVQIIDTLLLAHQQPMAEFYSLESLAIQFGFRSEKRFFTFASVADIKEAWLSRDPERVTEIVDQLIYSAENQKFVTDYFLEKIWPQQQWVPLPLQQLAIAGSDEKWNAILSEFYKPYEYSIIPNGERYFPPERDVKRNFEGCIIGCEPGLYHNFARIALENLYPSIITRFGLTDIEKDPVRLGEIVLSALNSTIQENGPDSAAAKSLSHAYHEFLSKQKSPYNSMTMAAITVGYARIILKSVIKALKPWCNIISISADSLIIQPTQCAPWTLTEGQVNHEHLLKQVQAVIPEGITAFIDLSCPDGAIYSPKVFSHVFWENSTAPAIRKGSYRQRHRSGLQKQFPIEYLRLIAFEGQCAADDYYQAIIQRLDDSTASGKPDGEILKLVTYNRRISTAARKLVDAGVGKPGENVHYYWASTKVQGKYKTRTEKFPIKVNVDAPGNYTIAQTDSLNKLAEQGNLDFGLMFGWYKVAVDKLKGEIDKVLSPQS